MRKKLSTRRRTKPRRQLKRERNGVSKRLDRKHRWKAREEEEQRDKVRANNAAAQHKCRAKKTTQLPRLPQTPNSKANPIAILIESATPSTSAKLQDKNLHKKEERAARCTIVKGATSVVKSKTIRRVLLPEIKVGNKAAVSKMLGISRNNLLQK